MYEFSPLFHAQCFYFLFFILLNSVYEYIKLLFEIHKKKCFMMDVGLGAQTILLSCFWRICIERRTFQIILTEYCRAQKKTVFVALGQTKTY